MGRKLRVLIVEDNERDAALLVRELQRGGYDLAFKRVDTQDAMNAAIETQSWDLVVSDYSMPCFSAQAALALVKERALDLPFIIVSGAVGEEVAVEAMRAGAHDFMPKGKFTRLLPAIRRELQEATGRAERRVIEHQLRDAKQREATERKRQDAELARHVAALERSNQELDDFAYIASHDLKEPLRGLSNNAKFLRDDYADKLDQDGVNRLLRLGYLSQRMEQLVNDLLYFSRLGRQDLAIQPTDLNAVIRDIEMMSETTLTERNVTIVIPRPLPPISCDTTRITEVFRNLISNAAKYNDNEAKRIEIGRLPTLETRHGTENDVFYVRDNGIGIAAEFHEDIFRIFKRLNAEDNDKKGTGVGLTFVRKIIERHGGRIWLNSLPGKGTTFYFTIGKGAACEAAA
jgi:signal transduction histidine kinase